MTSKVHTSKWNLIDTGRKFCIAHQSHDQDPHYIVERRVGLKAKLQKVKNKVLALRLAKLKKIGRRSVCDFEPKEVKSSPGLPGEAL